MEFWKRRNGFDHHQEIYNHDKVRHIIFIYLVYCMKCGKQISVYYTLKNLPEFHRIPLLLLNIFKGDNLLSTRSIP